MRSHTITIINVNSSEDLFERKTLHKHLIMTTHNGTLELCTVGQEALALALRHIHGADCRATAGDYVNWRW